MPEPSAPPLLSDGAISALARLLLSVADEGDAHVLKIAVGPNHAGRRNVTVPNELREIATEMREAAT